MGIVRLSTLVSLVDQGPLRFALNSRAMLGRGYPHGRFGRPVGMTAYEIMRQARVPVLSFPVRRR